MYDKLPTRDNTAQREVGCGVESEVVCVQLQISEFAAPPLPPPPNRTAVVSSRRHCHCQCYRSTPVRRSVADSSLPVVHTSALNPSSRHTIYSTLCRGYLCVSRSLSTRMFLVLDRCSVKWCWVFWGVSAWATKADRVRGAFKRTWVPSSLYSV